MCDCERHLNPQAQCTCICPAHANFQAAYELAEERYDALVTVQAELEEARQTIRELRRGNS